MGAVNGENNNITLENNIGPLIDKEPVHSVTNQTFFNYFNNDGSLKTNFTGKNLTFKGEFNNLEIDSIIINRPIEICGEGAILTNIAFNIYSNNVCINGIKFNINSLEYAINILSNNVIIENNIINYNATVYDDSTAITGEDISNLTIANNEINFSGATNGVSHDTIILIENINNITLSNNKINGFLASVDIKYHSTGKWAADIKSQAIAITGSNINVINNDLRVKYNRIPTKQTVNSIWYDPDAEIGFYNTIHSYVITGDNIKFKNNNITSLGIKFVYGLLISGKDVIIDENIFNINATEYYAGGISIGNPYQDNAVFNGVISNNKITVKSQGVVYGTFSFGNVTARYINNTIFGRSSAVYGIETVGVYEELIKNKIDVAGNYTIGIGSGKSINTPTEVIIEDNKINLNSQGLGAINEGDTVIPCCNAGIYITPYVVKTTISNNEIIANFPSLSSANNGGIISYASNVLIYNNKIEIIPTRSNGDNCSIVGAELNGNNIKFENNKLNLKGIDYAYGLIEKGKNNQIVNNEISVINENSFAYGIFSNDKKSIINYTSNNITINGKIASGMDLNGNIENVSYNTINVYGDNSNGIITNSSLITINNNTIVSKSIENNAEGILIYSSKANITENNIKTDGEYTINIVDNTNNEIIVKNNYLISNFYIGDKSVNGGKNLILDNIPKYKNNTVENMGTSLNNNTEKLFANHSNVIIKDNNEEKNIDSQFNNNVTNEKYLDSTKKSINEDKELKMEYLIIFIILVLILSIYFYLK